ncbi:hypothetical protein HNP37_002342 [Flavobacterium nitrogenifigens]|uniref:Uncharacterized protein n=2 Tax=Flavobacterium TaxID=237 RepID=A0A7W7IX75_9FLAO|nr:MULTISPECIES: hypothetical protein [Flavobacterium]MBB4802269.1 hypothetical protein [Flavobacterium nitrogenifigens]MBB6387227.1 hypothetical protein [Flavobacterium notoginsengisoli]
MKNLNNENYGQFDPDYIDQNTPIDYQADSFYDEQNLFQNINEDNYGDQDPDIIDQNTSVGNENAIYEEDYGQYQYQEEFIDDGKSVSNDSYTNESLRAENIPNQERIINEDGRITNDSEINHYNNNDNTDPSDLDLENDIEKDSDFDKDEELNDFDAEHYPENHPRE